MSGDMAGEAAVAPGEAAAAADKLQVSVKGEEEENGLEEGLSSHGHLSPSSSGSVLSTISSISPHYNAEQDVVSRMEFLGGREMRAVILSVWAAVVLALALLCLLLGLKVQKGAGYFLEKNTIPILNISFAAVMLPALGVMWVLYMRRIYRSNLSGKRWSERRKKGTQMSAVGLTLQVVNVTFFLLPNAYVLANECGWFDPVIIWSGLVRWTIWNTLFLLYWIQAANTNPVPSAARRGRLWHCCVCVAPAWAGRFSRPDAILMDLPWAAHAPKLLLWMVVEAALLGISLELQLNASGMVEQTLEAARGAEGGGVDCRQLLYSCHLNTAATVFLCINIAGVIAYFLLFSYHIRRSFAALAKKPYTKYRMANLVVRLQTRLNTLGMSFFVLCAITYTFVAFNTCQSYMVSWLGYLPMQVVMTATQCAYGYITMPKRPNETRLLRVWLQEFAWTERDVPRKRFERSSSLPPESLESFCMDCEPMFCFETTIKLLFWSFLVYDYEEAATSPFSVDTALSLYDLEHFECFWEKTMDTKAIVGWNEDTVVIAFRGTASLANVRADLQVWRSRWPEGVGNAWTCSAPRVHQGFLKAWQLNGFSERIISRLSHILYRCAEDKQQAGSERPVQVYCTGHSLGGALAMLCALDIKKHCPCAEYMINIKCYTFGAPRPGNHPFARMFNEAVPDSWSIINNDDAVTRAGKFLTLYKRPGHRVLINKLGDLVVRPSYVESTIRKLPGGGSIRDHLLTSYQKAMVAVVAAQFGSKMVDGGKEGAMALAATESTRSVLSSAGLAYERLQALEQRGLEALGAAQKDVRGRSLLNLLGACSGLCSGSGPKGPQPLEAVVVDQAPAAAAAEEEKGAALTPDEEKGEAAAELAAPPAAAAAEAGAAVGAAPGVQPGVVAVELLPPPQQQAERQLAAGEPIDSVVHTSIMRCRQRRGKKGRTVCQLMQRPRGGAAARQEAPSFMCDMPPVPETAQRAQQVQAEEQPQQQGGRSDASATQLAASALQEEDPGQTPSTSTRGNVADMPAFPLVFSLSDELHSGSLPPISEDGASAANGATSPPI